MNTDTVADRSAAPMAQPAGAPLALARPAAVRRAVFVDPASRHLLALAQRVAQADVTTLLVGPTGAGKEVMARVLHESSRRRSGPFVAINCAALPEQLIESQLFGHEKGAFTGAQRAHRGLFEQADGGTLFLDEIGDMPAHLQTRLLRVLQERQVTRLGSETPIPVDVRLVAATNKDLRQAMAQREFREDLYYRIATFRLSLPPLAQRPGDIVPLALQFVAQHAAPGAGWQVTQEARELLLHYPWPGNVRELENVMRRAMVLSADGVIGPQQLMFDDWVEAAAGAPTAVILSAAPASVAEPLPATQPATTEPAAVHESWRLPGAAMVPTPTPTLQPEAPASALLPAGAPAGGLQSAVRHNESQIILATIAAAPSRNEAARRLGISPRTLRYKLAQLRAQAQAQSALHGLADEAAGVPA